VGEEGTGEESPYWNPRHETMPRAQIEALRTRKLKTLSPGPTQAPGSQTPRAGGVAGRLDSKACRPAPHPHDDPRRVDCRASSISPPYGPILAAPPEAATGLNRPHPPSEALGQHPDPAVACAEMWAVLPSGGTRMARLRGAARIGP